MKKSKNIPLIMLIVLVLFVLIAFIIPVERDSSFYIAFAFGIFAIAFVSYLWIVDFDRLSELKDKFLNIPILNIANIYLGIQMLFSFIFMLVTLPIWLEVLVNIILAGGFIIIILGLNSAKSAIINTENKVKAKRMFLKELEVEIKLLLADESDEEIRKKLEKLQIEIRYSDPMSSDKLFSLEEKIQMKISDLKDTADKNILIDDISKLLYERNEKSKIYK